MVENTNDQKARVIIISGFLGSGKTTFIQQVLQSGIDLSETVVVVNEFGKISIDGLLLKDAGTDVVELASGCVCCTLRIDLIRTLRDIWSQYEPRRVFIEATGVADPDGIVEALKDPDISPYMDPALVVTVMDCEYWEGREVFGPVFFRQIEKADIILLNKVDLVGKEKVAQVLGEIHEMFPGCRVIPTVFCKVDLEVIWSHLSDVEEGPVGGPTHPRHERGTEWCGAIHEGPGVDGGQDGILRQGMSHFSLMRSVQSERIVSVTLCTPCPLRSSG